MQCVQCWNGIKVFDIRCSTCNEIFCSQDCLDKHTADVADAMQAGIVEAKYENEMMDFQDEYPSIDRYELANKYPWER